MNTAKRYIKVARPYLLANERLAYSWLGRHPRIVECMNIGETDEEIASEEPLVLAMAPNGDLREYMQKHPNVPQRLRARWGLQIAEGLALLHEKRVVWADCTPANMLLTDDLDILLCDFGGAGIGGFENYAAPPLCYSDPEQDNAGAFMGQKSLDIFAFGCVFLEILTYNADFLRKEHTLTRGGLASNGQLLIDCIAFAPFKHIVENCWDGKYKHGSQLYDAMRDAFDKFEKVGNGPHGEVAQDGGVEDPSHAASGGGI
ncbi:kinase-like domain-containing protein [Mycena pura]|uniref:Kinase-like domain-containing protein n=1 Tax=Mycena pura TaxID=153505 RepID=A0AAD6XVL7_9AGAR|nr:kinase-like domain-containing protein [Mycena pura]